jgi:hypothetical protein
MQVSLGLALCMSARLKTTFERLKREGRTGFVAFVTVGFPSIEATLEAVPALVAGGADVIELGVPSPTPSAKGTTIQRASFHALENGVTPQVCLDVLRKLRAGGLAAPVILMGYYNPILAYGIDDFCRDAADAGADGFIVVDLPPEESGPSTRPARRTASASSTSWRPRARTSASPRSRSSPPASSTASASPASRAFATNFRRRSRPSSNVCESPHACQSRWDLVYLNPSTSKPLAVSRTRRSSVVPLST